MTTWTGPHTYVSNDSYCGGFYWQVNGNTAKSFRLSWGDLAEASNTSNFASGSFYGTPGTTNTLYVQFYSGTYLTGNLLATDTLPGVMMGTTSQARPPSQGAIMNNPTTDGAGNVFLSWSTNSYSAADYFQLYRDGLFLQTVWGTSATDPEDGASHDYFVSGHNFDACGDSGYGLPSNIVHFSSGPVISSLPVAASSGMSLGTTFKTIPSPPLQFSSSAKMTAVASGLPTRGTPLMAATSSLTATADPIARFAGQNLAASAQMSAPSSFVATSSGLLVSAVGGFTIKEITSNDQFAALAGLAFSARFSEFGGNPFQAFASLTDGGIDLQDEVSTLSSAGSLTIGGNQSLTAGILIPLRGSVVNAGAITHVAGLPMTIRTSMADTGAIRINSELGLFVASTALFQQPIVIHLGEVDIETLAAMTVGADPIREFVGPTLAAYASLSSRTQITNTSFMQVLAALLYAPTEGANEIFDPPYLTVDQGSSETAFFIDRDARVLNTPTASYV